MSATVLKSPSTDQPPIQFQDRSQICEWCARYGLNPEPHKVIYAIKALSEIDLQIATLFSKILKEHPNTLFLYLSSLAEPGIPKEKSQGVLQAIWLSELPEGIQAIEDLTTQGKTKWIREFAEKLAKIKEPIDPLGGSVIDELTIEKVNLCWGNYFYSREEKYIQKILSYWETLAIKFDSSTIALIAKTPELPNGLKKPMIGVKPSPIEYDLFTQIGEGFIYLSIVDKNVCTLYHKLVSKKGKETFFYKEIFDKIIAQNRKVNEIKHRLTAS